MAYFQVVTAKITQALNWLQPLRLWWHAIMAWVMGVLSVFAFAPEFIAILYLMAIASLVLLLDMQKNRPRPLLSAAIIGWAFGFGFHLFGLSWIGSAFLVDAEEFAVYMPFAMTLLPAGLALFFALVGALYSWLGIYGPLRVVWFGLLLFMAEWLRGNILTGLPWNLPGYIWADHLPIMQSSAVIGVYGLSLLTVIWGASPATLFAVQRGEIETQKAGWLPLVLMTGLMGVLATSGALRLSGASSETVDGVLLRIVQPSIPQKEKWLKSKIQENFQKFLDLSAADRTGQAPTHILWPEAATPFVLDRDMRALSMIGDMLNEDQTLVTGAIRVEPKETSGYRYYSSVHVVDTDGLVIETYDKAHLVPFGEYLPFKPLMRLIGLGTLTEGGGYSSGPGPQTVPVQGAPAMSPLICYEAIFPDDVVRGERPGWLLNVSNDAWYGESRGPRQHLVQTQYRAIEQGLPLVRSANTGISIVFDGYGRELGRLELNEKGVLDLPLPAALKPTLYSKAADAPVLITWLSLVIFMMVSQGGVSRIMRGRMTRPPID